MKIEMMDKFYFPETERTYTDEGYLIVPATISRPGTQIYKASELVSSPELLPNNLHENDIVTVYRPPTEVFRQESIDSFKNIAVTNSHPPEFLNSKNYKKYSVGIVLSDVECDEKHVKATLKVTDYETINDIKDGKVDVSAGYHSNICFEEGETPEGEKYQAIQRDISGNHVAIVVRGRAGSEVKLADGLSVPSERRETLVAEGVKGEGKSESAEELGGIGSSEKEKEEFGADGVPGDNSLNAFGDEKQTSETTEVDDEDNKNEKEPTMELKDALAKIADLTSQNEILSSQVLDQAGLDALVADRMSLIDSCSKLVEGLEYTGKSNGDLKKEVLASKMPGVNLEDKSMEYIDAAFDVLKSSIADSVEGKHDEDTYGKDLGAKVEDEVEPTEEEETEVEDSTETEDEEVEVKDSVSVLDSAFETEVIKENKSKELSPYEKYCERSRTAWKNNNL